MNLGRIVNHDPQSRDYVDLRLSRRQPSPGYSVRHTMAAPNVDQFYTSGCVGFAGANFLNCAKAVRSRMRFNKVFRNPPRYSRSYLDNDDGLDNYSGSTEYDPFNWTYPPIDGGSSALGLMKYWKKYGVITGYDWCFTFNQFLAQLQHQPVLVGTEWFEGMTNAGNLTIVSPSGESQGGHEYLATSITWNTRLIGFQNSWGENWGFKGGFFMRFEVFKELLANGGDACVPRVL